MENSLSERIKEFLILGPLRTTPEKSSQLPFIKDTLTRFTEEWADQCEKNQKILTILLEKKEYVQKRRMDLERAEISKKYTHYVKLEKKIQLLCLADMLYELNACVNVEVKGYR